MDVAYVDVNEYLPVGKYGQVQIDRVRLGGKLCSSLRLGGILLMTDEPDERKTNAEFVQRARGRVLISGLGLGMILIPVLAKSEVEHVTVVEVSPEVAAAVEPAVRRHTGANEGQLSVVVADALSWLPPEDARYETIYHDISLGNDVELRRAQCAQLCRRYLPYLSDGGWQGCWSPKLPENSHASHSVRV